MILITAKTPIATLSENGISKVLQSMTEITRNIEEKLFESQQISKQDIATEVIEANQKIKETILYGVKETVANAAAATSSTIEKVVLNSKIELTTDLSEKISSELSTKVEEIKENQENAKNLLSNVLQNQADTKEIVFEKLEQTNSEI